MGEVFTENGGLKWVQFADVHAKAYLQEQSWNCQDFLSDISLPKYFGGFYGFGVFCANAFALWTTIKSALELFVD